MNTTKAMYWIALAAIALALNSEYQHGRFPSVHRVADRTGSALCRIATHAEQALAMARVLTSRQVFPAADLRAATTEMAENRADIREQARGKAELFRDQVLAQAEMMRARTKLQRAQIEQIRFLARSHFQINNASDRHLITVGPGDCANSAVRIAINSKAKSFADLDDDDGDLF